MSYDGVSTIADIYEDENGVLQVSVGLGGCACGKSPERALRV
jgi:hypothetical protein